MPCCRQFCRPLCFGNCKNLQGKWQRPIRQQRLKRPSPDSQAIAVARCFCNLIPVRTSY